MNVTDEEFARARGWAAGYLAMSKTRPEHVRLFAVCGLVGHAPDSRGPAMGECARCGCSLAASSAGVLPLNGGGISLGVN